MYVHIASGITHRLREGQEKQKRHCKQ